jgi:hypothetical protein
MIEPFYTIPTDPTDAEIEKERQRRETASTSPAPVPLPASVAELLAVVNR